MELSEEDWSKLSPEELMDRKGAIETEMQACNTVLENGGVGMNGRLVDDQGFPRADIDVYAVRRARNRIICLRNDHKAVMKLIEEKLHQLHAETRLRRGAESEGVARGEERRILPMTFARVSQVTDGSPAASAVSQTTGGHIMECALRGPQGVKAGDRIAEFGSVTAANFTGLKNVADVVQHSVGSPVHVLLVRGGEPVSLSLTPRRWHGLGLLGSAIFLSLSNLSLSLSSLQVCDCTFITSSQQNLLS
jgi:26S proteasome non-ATPase regulatory subunit 9